MIIFYWKINKKQMFFLFYIIAYKKIFFLNKKIILKRYIIDNVNSDIIFLKKIYFG